MKCMTCNHELSACACPDFMERMAKLSRGVHFRLCWGSTAFDNPRMQRAIGMTAAEVAEARRVWGPTTVVKLSEKVGEAPE